MTDFKTGFEVLVSAVADTKSSDKAIDEIVKSLLKDLKDGYIEVPAEVKFGKKQSKELKEAADKFQTDWAKIASKGFFADVDKLTKSNKKDLVNFLRSYEAVTKAMDKNARKSKQWYGGKIAGQRGGKGSLQALEERLQQAIDAYHVDMTPSSEKVKFKKTKIIKPKKIKRTKADERADEKYIADLRRGGNRSAATPLMRNEHEDHTPLGTRVSTPIDNPAVTKQSLKNSEWSGAYYTYWAYLSEELEKAKNELGAETLQIFKDMTETINIFKKIDKSRGRSKTYIDTVKGNRLFANTALAGGGLMGPKEDVSADILSHAVIQQVLNKLVTSSSTDFTKNWNDALLSVETAIMNRFDNIKGNIGLNYKDEGEFKGIGVNYERWKQSIINTFKTLERIDLSTLSTAFGEAREKLSEATQSIRNSMKQTDTERKRLEKALQENQTTIANEDYNSKKRRLNANNKNIESEITEYQAELAKKEKEALNPQIVALRQELNKAKKALEKNKDAKAEYDQDTELRSSLLNKRSNLQSKGVLSNKEDQERKKEIASIDQEVASIEKKLKSNTYDKALRKYNEINSELDKLQPQVSRPSMFNKQTGDLIYTRSKTLSELNTTELQKRIDDLQVQYKKNEKELSDINKLSKEEKKVKRDHIEQLKAENEQIKSKLAELPDKQDFKNQEIDAKREFYNSDNAAFDSVFKQLASAFGLHAERERAADIQELTAEQKIATAEEKDVRTGGNTDANFRELIDAVNNINSTLGTVLTTLEATITSAIAQVSVKAEEPFDKSEETKFPVHPNISENGYFAEDTIVDDLKNKENIDVAAERSKINTKASTKFSEASIKLFSEAFDPLYASIQKNMFKMQTGGIFKNLFSFFTGGAGYGSMQSLEKSRGLAETANIIAGSMSNKFETAELVNDEEAMLRLSIDAQRFADAMKEAGGDLEKVSKKFKFISPELQKENIYLKNIGKGLNRNGEVLKHQTRLGEVMSYTFQLMSRYIGQSIKRLLLMISPLSLIRRAFSDFTGYSTKWQRTMNVIKYNLRAVIRPIMEKIAQIIVNIIGLLQSLASGLFGKKIDLFDQAAADSEKIHEELEAAANVSAGFDELHDIGSDNSGANDLMGDIYTPEWEGLQDIFENIGSTIHNIFDFIKGLNFWQWLAIGGAALLGFLALKTLINWFTKGKNPLQTIADGASFLEKAVGWSVLILSIAAFVAVLKDFIDVVGHMEPEEIAQAMIALGLSLAGLAVTFAGLLYIAKMFGASFLETLGVAAIVAALALLVGAITLFVNAVKDIESEHLYDILTQLSEVMIIMAVIIGVLAVVAAKLGPTLAVAGVGILEISAAISIVILALAVLVKALDGSGDDIKMILDGISNVVHSVGNVIIGVITAVANTFVAAVNTIIAGAKVVGAIFGKNINAQYIPQINAQYIPKYEQGTNYVPNDGLAYLHQGEAVIPKKYNQLNNTTGLTNEERTYMQQMMVTMKSLDGTMKQGIKVNGQFVQRGSDLVAVVNKTKSQTGADLISNVAYAR